MPRRLDNLPAHHRGGPVAATVARPGLPADAAGAMQEKLRLLVAGTAHLRDEYGTAALHRELARNRLEDAGRPALALPPEHERSPTAARLAGSVHTAEPAACLPALLGAACVSGIAGEVPPARGWTRVRDMPGAYLQNEGIRALMRRQQRQWPCFARHEAIWEAQGRDPLGMVVGLNLVQGMPGADADEIQRVAGWIRENGVVIDAQRVDFGQAFGNYTAEVVLATTEDKTFLLVREPAENGFSGMHIYAWDGGTAVYRDGPGRAFLVERADARAVARPAERIAAPIGLIPGPAEPRSIAIQERGGAGDRRALVRALPAAASPSIAAAADRLAPLRTAGFQPWGSKEGPCLRRPEEDGTTTVLLGEPGKPLARSETFRVRSLDQAGVVLDVRTIDDPEDLLRRPSSGPRP